MAESPPELILASASQARRALLQNAGLVFRVIPSSVDEHQIRRALLEARPHANARSIAEALAKAKAEQVSATHPHALVIGADQTLELDGRLLSKASDLSAARRQLLDLRGRRHHLHSAFALAMGGRAGCTASETATLVMREFSPAFLDRYLAEAGEKVLWSVGAYELEGLGVQLFQATDGDYFTILGLPLLQLLERLRDHGAVQQ